MSGDSPGARGLDLNTCGERELASICDVGQERARRVVQARPLRTWDDVRRLEGFDAELLHTMQHAGARIGGTGGGGDRPGRDHAE